jgi:hypothetical protein
VSDHIKLTSQDFYKTEDLIPEAVLDDADPIHEIKRLAGLSNANSGQLAEYTGYDSTKVQLDKTHVSMSALIGIFVR